MHLPPAWSHCAPLSGEGTQVCALSSPIPDHLPRTGGAAGSPPYLGEVDVLRGGQPEAALGALVLQQARGQPVRQAHVAAEVGGRVARGVVQLQGHPLRLRRVQHRLVAHQPLRLPASPSSAPAATPRPAPCPPTLSQSRLGTLTKPLRAAKASEVQLKRLGGSQPLCSSQ